MNISRIIPNIPSFDLNASRQFFIDFVGLELVEERDWMLTFAVPSNPTARVNVVLADPNQQERYALAVTFEVDDVDALYAKATANKIPIPYPLTSEIWGVRRFMVQNVSGVTLIFLSRNPALAPPAVV